MGYPHRSADDLGMQIRLARFLYSADARSDIRDTILLPVVRKLSKAIVAVNAQFLASKVVFRTRLVNVFANASKVGIHGTSRDSSNRLSIHEASDDSSNRLF